MAIFNNVDINLLSTMTEDHPDSNIRLCYELNKAIEKYQFCYSNDKFIILKYNDYNTWTRTAHMDKDYFIKTVLTTFPEDEKYIKYFSICFINDELEKYDLKIRYLGDLHYAIYYNDTTLLSTTALKFDELETNIKIALENIDEPA